MNELLLVLYLLLVLLCHCKAQDICKQLLCQCTKVAVHEIARW